MAPFFANRSCDPFQPRSAQCVIGSYVQYAINVSSAADVSAGIKFATEKNIRLVIRNTGHDYLGKSTGSGALGLWMHHLKDIDFIDYHDSHYSGKAIKVGAGVQGFEVYAAADAHGLQVVGGECPTVGFAGGYTQGGGHSMLTSKHGMAADQTLEWELVTGAGEHVIANREQNSELYWALSGGGGGTYGVVISLTSKAHPDTPTSGANLTFTSGNTTLDKYYEAISAYHASLPAMVDAGVMSIEFFDNKSFAINPVTGPNITVEELRDFLQPLTDKLHELEIPYTSYFGQFSSYLEYYNAMMTTVEIGVAQYGGRLLPRSLIETNNDAVTDAFRIINENGGTLINQGLRAPLALSNNTDGTNAVNPSWRTTLIDVVITTPWSFTASWGDMLSNQRLMTDVLVPELARLTPNGSCYLNEADPFQPEWKSVFYGSNYNTLNTIKDKYDPNHMFYAQTAVGSDYWKVQSDGRLCKAI